MFESDIESDGFMFSGTADIQNNRIVLVLEPEKYAPQIQRIRFGDKMEEWGYKVVTCTVSSSEIEQIGKFQFDQLYVVLNRINSGLDPLKKAVDVAIVALEELSGLAISIYFMNRNISRIILLNPYFCSGISNKLSRVEIPTDILFSGNAERSVASSSRKYHDLISGSTLHNIPGLKREEILTKKTQFFSYLRSFLVDDQ